MLIKLFMPKFWQHTSIISYLLLPFSFIFQMIIFLRRIWYKLIVNKKFQVPLIVVGNIVVGGAGKTPMVIALAKVLKEHGYNPGIICRGYGGKNAKDSVSIVADTKHDQVGDEPLVIAHRTKLPVVVNSDRVAAAEELISKHGCDLIISDDGLQHYALYRDIEIAVIDEEFKFGNGFCFPAGPLREPLSRLDEVDFVMHNFNMNPPVHDQISDEYYMILAPTVLRNVKDPESSKTIDEFKDQTVHAVAGIGRPEKFFHGLKNLGFKIIEHPFPDHYVYLQTDFPFSNGNVIITEKDAVKCKDFANESFWYMEVEAILNEQFVSDLVRRLNKHYDS